MNSADPLILHLRSIASGDETALENLYDKTCGLVFGLVLRIVSDHELAEEATLDTYTQVWRRAGSYDATRSSVKTWLLLLARSRAIDALRSQRRHLDRQSTLSPEFDVGDPGANPELDLAASERAHRIRSALATLPDEQRHAIEVAFFRGLSHAEVAEFLQQPLGTIKTRIRTGLTTLRKALVLLEDGPR